MGYTTEFEGEFRLDRPLTVQRTRYLHKFSDTRRMKRAEAKAQAMADPDRLAVGLPIGQDACYFVGGLGSWGQDEDDSVVAYNNPPSDQPGLWCQWVPTDDRQAIVWNGAEKFYCYVEWLDYLIKHFLGSWGYTLNGRVQWQGEDPDDQGVIEVVNNRVFTGPGHDPCRPTHIAED